MPDQNPVDDQSTADWFLPANLQPELRLFLEYWQSKIGPDGEIPCFSDIDPTEIPALMPGIAIVRRLSDANHGIRYHYRYVGTDHFEANSQELTGRYFDEIYPPEFQKPALQVFEKIIQTGTPHYWARPNPLPHRDVLNYERILVPLTDKTGQVAMLIGYWRWY